MDQRGQLGPYAGRGLVVVEAAAQVERVPEDRDVGVRPGHETVQKL